MKKTIVVAIALALTACATSPEKMQAVTVSPLAYTGLDCDQIAQELRRTTTRAAELQGSLKKKSENDAAQMTVGLILFWPALFFLEGGDGPEAAEYAHLKGEKTALEEVGLKKKCANLPKIIEAKPGETQPQQIDSSTQAGAMIKTGTNNAVVAPAPSSSPTPIRSASASDRLKELDKLYKDGLINQTEFDAKRQEILKSM